MQPISQARVESNQSALAAAFEKPTILERDAALVDSYKLAVLNNGADSLQANDAFTAIFDTYKNYVFWLLGSKGVQSETAEDLAQQVFFTVWERLNGKEIITNLRGLVTHSFKCRLATYLEKTHHKKSNGTSVQTISLNSIMSTSCTSTQFTAGINGAGGKEIVLVSNTSRSPLQLNLLERLYDPDENIEQAVIQRELWQQVRTLIAQMPQNYRLALLQQLTGLELAEIAARNDWSLDQTKKYVVRARRWLAKCVQPFTVKTA